MGGYIQKWAAAVFWGGRCALCYHNTPSLLHNMNLHAYLPFCTPPAGVEGKSAGNLLCFLHCHRLCGFCFGMQTALFSWNVLTAFSEWCLNILSGWYRCYRCTPHVFPGDEDSPGCRNSPSAGCWLCTWAEALMFQSASDVFIKKKRW